MPAPYFRVPRFGSYLIARRSGAVCVAILLILVAVGVHAVPLVGTDGTTLVRFDSNTPGTTTTTAITGLLNGEVLVGIDYRPKNGLLYGTGDAGHLYTINPTTGAATKVGSGSFQVTGSDFGTAIDPLADQLRIVGNTGANKRINLDTGIKIAADGLVAGGPGTVGAQVTGIAYSNAYFDASTTTCYAISANTDFLYTIGDPNTDSEGAKSGFLRDVGSLVLEGAIDSHLGFVIAPDGVAYAAINYTSEFRLYTVNLQQGFATNKGKIGSNPALTAFRGLTALTGPQTFSNSQPILIPAAGTTGTASGAKASLYPSAITVANLVGGIQRLKVTISDFRHTFPDDVDMMLAAPNGGPVTFGFPLRYIFFSDVGGQTSTCGSICDNGNNPGTTGVTITLEDNAATLLPDTGGLASGIFRPTNVVENDPFPAPAPTPPLANAAPARQRDLRASRSCRPERLLAVVRRR